MAYPPTPPPNDRVNTTPMVDSHPSDHNILADAIADILTELGDNPKGSYTDVEERLDVIIAEGAPVGQIIMSGHLSSNPPPGRWLHCAGGTASRTGETAALFAVIGTAYGNGDGSTTFNLPDFRGRGPVGVGTATGGSAIGRGEALGKAVSELVEHVHTMPSHSHTINNHTHDTSINPPKTYTEAPNESRPGYPTPPPNAPAGQGMLYGEAGNGSYGNSNSVPATPGALIPGALPFVNIPAFTETSGNPSNRGTNSVDPGDTNSAGDPAADNGNYQPSLGVEFWIRY